MLDVLTRIQDYAAAYVTDKVTINISNLQPVDHQIIGPGEDFSFTVSAENAAEENGGVRLTNVIWHVWIDSQTSTPPTALYVPELANLHTWLTPDLRGDPLDVNPSSRYQELFIVPQGGRGVLDVDERNRLDLRGWGTSADGGGSAQINFEIIATLDLAIPESQSGSPVSIPISVRE